MSDSRPAAPSAASSKLSASNAESKIFEPLTINGVTFRNRLLRSSVGGRTCNYDGTVTDIWKNFEKRFADGGAGGVISTTFHVNKDRLSPPQYPSIAADKYVPYLKKYIAAIKQGHADFRYIVQIGDPGHATYSSLFPEKVDAMSSSGGFDLIFGYNNRREPMQEPDILRSIREFGDAAARVRECGADGIEVTIAKGYLIHQFLSPVVNRRNDAWGGDADRRFKFAATVLEEVRRRVGKDFLLGVRLSAEDLALQPFLLGFSRFPFGSGNNLEQMLDYATRLQKLGVDYLHVISGYGFPNPRDVPGKFPYEELKQFFNHYRHLSRKTAIRATVVNALPDFLGRWLTNIGWRYREAINLPAALKFKQHLNHTMPIIVNSGFQNRELIEQALSGCDMVSMARALIANPNLPNEFKAGATAPKNPCNYCNRCVGRTGTSPLGCYDLSRFKSQREMVDQIMEWNQPDPA